MKNFKNDARLTVGQWSYGNACEGAHLCLSHVVYQEIWKIGRWKAITAAVNSFAD